MTDVSADTSQLELDAVNKEIDELDDKIDRLYWLFTRCAKGRPPSLVAPDLYGRRGELRRRRAQLIREKYADEQRRNDDRG